MSEYESLGGSYSQFIPRKNQETIGRDHTERMYVTTPTRLRSIQIRHLPRKIVDETSTNPLIGHLAGSLEGNPELAEFLCGLETQLLLRHGSTPLRYEMILSYRKEMSNGISEIVVVDRSNDESDGAHLIELFAILLRLVFRIVVLTERNASLNAGRTSKGVGVNRIHLGDNEHGEQHGGPQFVSG